MEAVDPLHYSSYSTYSHLPLPLMNLTFHKVCLVFVASITALEAPQLVIMGAVVGLALGPKVFDQMQKRVFAAIMQLELEMIAIGAVLATVVTVVYASLLLPVATGLYTAVELKR